MVSSIIELFKAASSPHTTAVVLHITYRALEERGQYRIFKIRRITYQNFGSLRIKIWWPSVSYRNLAIADIAYRNFK